MRRLALALIGTAAVVAFSLPLNLNARPNRYGHSDREERHMLPAVSSGPLNPAWSPDGRWLAFSMRGDIWKMPAEGGEAIALTSGPAYHFEPAWSPDGARIAFAFQATGNLDIGIVSANGGPVGDAMYSEMVRMSGPKVKGFAEGGYTGHGLKYEPAGIVHKGEYVVPQNGSLVIRGDNSEIAKLLSEIKMLLARIEKQGPGRVNATIYTRENQVKSGDLVNAAYRTVNQK